MTTSQDLDAALQASQDQPIVLFKHSNSCPFSARAQVQISNAKHDIEIYGIVIQYAKELSQEIAERLDVEHKSPQAIVVYRGRTVSDYWRSDIQEERLKQEVSELSEAA